MPGWNEDERYALEGEGGGGNLVGFPIEAYFDEKEWPADVPGQPNRWAAQLVIKFRRSHPELTPASKVEMQWSWGVGPGWRVADNGARVTHVEGKDKFNANTDIGKMFKAVKEVVPFIEGFDMTSAASWQSIEKVGDVEWGWLEERKQMRDPSDPTGKKYIQNPDPTALKRTMVPLRYIGDGASNGQADHVDLTTLDIPAELLPKLVEAAKEAVDGPTAQQKLIGFTMGHAALLSALTSNPEGLRQALLATEPF